MNMITTSKNSTFAEDQKALIEIDPRFKKWTDWNDSLIEESKGGRYIEVWQMPGCVRKFISGNYDEAMEKKRYWKIRFPFEDDTSGMKPELLGIFDREEKCEVTDEMEDKIK